MIYMSVYMREDGHLSEDTAQDPHERYPHSYSREDIALALASLGGSDEVE